MFEVTFLGTAAAAPATDRGLSSLLVQYEDRRFLVDCGEGTQRQLMQSGVGFRRIDRVLLTHGHLDHILGLAGLASTINLWRTAERLSILGGAEPLELVRRLLWGVVWPDGRPALAIELKELSAGMLMEEGRLSVIAFPVSHRAADCFGFRFEARGRRPLLTERLAELGVPSGPERGALARGEAVTLADGRRIEPEQVLGKSTGGASLAIVGDTGSTDDLLPHVRGVDALVIEATFLENEADKARERSHLTAAQAARLAGEAGVGELWLNHLSTRYRAAEIEAEARAVFPNAHAAHDFARFRVPRP
jgi:ribonuclease Z